MFAALRAEPQPKEQVRKKLAVDEDLFDKALEKLWVHKGVVLDFAENVVRGEEPWRVSYVLQGEQKRAQIDQMMRFAESNSCRMNSLVRHFGDISTSASACGLCDFCAPDRCVAQRFRTATTTERSTLYRVLRTLRSFPMKSTGKLHGELFPNNEMSRDEFEEVLGAMARAQLLTFADAVFEKDGRQIPYRTVSLTPAGRTLEETAPVQFVMKDNGSQTAPRKSRKKAGKPKVAKARKTAAASNESEIDARIEQALRAWRLSEAKRRKIPAFRIFSDKTLRAITQICPTTDTELLTVPGVGMGIVQKYGSQIYRLVGSARGYTD
jgi:superfamily II DNA helicase RecQ